MKYPIPIKWVVTIRKSYVDLQFDFTDITEAVHFAETAANSYREDSEKFSISVLSKVAETVVTKEQPKEEPAEC